jgi:hypothetical protein
MKADALLEAGDIDGQAVAKRIQEAAQLKSLALR